MEILRNCEGYLDPTAYIAIKNVMRGRVISKMEFKRGGVYYIEKGNSFGGRPVGGNLAVIVSHDEINKRKDEVSVVFLSRKLRAGEISQLSIKLDSVGQSSYAICRKVTSIPVDLVSEFLCTLTSEEMARIDQALILSISLKQYVSADANLVDANRELQARVAELEASNQILRTKIAEQSSPTELQTRFDMLQAMYNDLLSKLLARKGA